MMTLKELRMWHWRALMRARNQQRKHEAEADKLQMRGNVASMNERNRKTFFELAKRETLISLDYQKKADFHLGAVQALNDVVSGHAETDCYEADKVTVGLVELTPAAMKKLRKDSQQ